MLKLDCKKIVEQISLFLFIVYITTIYIFSGNAQTLILSQIVFILFCVFASLNILINKKIYIHIYLIFYAFFLIYIILTYFWSIDQNASFIKIKTLMQIFILCILIYQLFYLTKRVDVFIKSLLIAGLVLCIYTIYIYTPSVFLKYLIIGKRFGGKVLQENIMGIYSATTFIICIYYGLYKKRRMFYLIGILPFMLAMATGSRKALIMIVLGVILLIYLKLGLKKVLNSTVITILLLIAFINIIELPIFSMIYNRLEGMLNTFTGTGKQETSAVLRKDMIRNGLNDFYIKPFFGYGVGSSGVLLQKSMGINTYFHCNYVEMLINGGIIAFTIFYSMYLYIIGKLISYISKKNIVSILIILILAVQLVIDVGSVSYYNKMVYVYLTIGFVMVKLEDDAKKLN